MSYQSPMADMTALLRFGAGFDSVTALDRYADVTPDLIDAVLTEAGRFADDIVAPLNRASDLDGAKMTDKGVVTTPGFKEAYAAYVEAGWNGLAFPEEVGGQNLPTALSLVVSDALFGACVSFSMGTCLTTGAVKALLAHGTPEQKELFLPKMVSGEWTGTMNLTEPQAGSDLSDIKTKAEPLGDGTYKIRGQKIYISYGEHDLTENICHLVLARLPGAPEGTKGISMFLVPRLRVKADGSLGEPNHVKAIGLEHKLGQHGSPTCTMAFSEGGDSIGTLVGKENEGLKNMFVMMNAARIDVGMQGVSIAERACQEALAWAQDRRQGRAPGDKDAGAVPIISHPDVQRMLMTMRAITDGGRALCYAAIVAHDVGHHGDERAAEREDLLTPLAKGFGTDRGCEVADLSIQVHGGMGFVEESGASQAFRDARITSIYEGTNGIQAIDLVGRKLGVEEGRLAFELIDEIETQARELKTLDDPAFRTMGERLCTASKDARASTERLVQLMAAGARAEALAGATPYLRQLGTVAAGHYLARAARGTLEAGDPSAQRRRDVALYYAQNVLPQAHAAAEAVRAAPVPEGFFAG